MNKRCNIILFYCICVVGLLGCFGCQQREAFGDNTGLSNYDAAELLFEYLYPGEDYFADAELIEGDNYSQYRFSLPHDGERYVRYINYDGTTGDYYRFSFNTDNFSSGPDGDLEYTNSNYYSGFAVHKESEEILQERYEIKGEGVVYSQKYLALLEQAENDVDEVSLVLSEDNQGNAVLAGTTGDNREFFIRLDYSLADVRVKNSYYVDLTGDGQKELCIELNIENSISSDLNTILIFDTESQELLFPRGEKAFIYDGDVVMPEAKLDTVLLYRDFVKVNGAGIESEYSMVRWREKDDQLSGGGDFETVKYYKKLLVSNEEYLVFYDNTEEWRGENQFKLVVLAAEDLTVLQEIEVVLPGEADVVEQIQQEQLVLAENVDEMGSLDLYITGYGFLYWDDEKKLFEADELFFDNEETVQIYCGDGLEIGLESTLTSDGLEQLVFDTYVCYPGYQGDRAQFTKEYLEARGMYKDEPDGFNERYGRRCSEYYVDEENQRVTFVFYRSWNRESRDMNGNPFTEDCIYYVTVDSGKLKSQGTLAMGWNENGEIDYQRSYDLAGGLEGYIAYEYDEDTPFPIISEYKEYLPYPQVRVNSAYYHTFYKADMDFDGDGKWVGYRSCFLVGRDSRHYSVCDYDSSGKLVMVREELSAEDVDNYSGRDSSGEILWEYDENGILESLHFWAAHGSHGIGSGASGTFEYDDKGRVVSWSFINGDVFFIYDGDCRWPWARVSIGGNAYSSCGVEDGIAYGHSTWGYLFLGD